MALLGTLAGNSDARVLHGEYRKKAGWERKFRCCVVKGGRDRVRKRFALNLQGG
jgi:hypothetical protein